jgi:hypothetical protein
MFLVLALLSNSVLPVAHAQSNTPLYLPIITNGNAPPQTDLVFRTHIQIQTPAQWRDLQRMEVVILEQGADWATVLVDDLQLEDLARLRYIPDQTNALQTLANANVGLQSAVANLLHQLAAFTPQIHSAGDSATTARAELRSELQALTVDQLEKIVQAASVDTDNDGLSNDQEYFWCTNMARADSDFDGKTDAEEATILKQWLNNYDLNQLWSKKPSTGRPFLGWPFTSPTSDCIDGDQDSVPDLAERLELGLSPDRESTDRDKFDDGQELFGITYCPGTGGFCGHGPLPRNADWGVIFAEMPSWVKAPGNHPFVAAYPVPEVNVVESSLKVQIVTTVTDGETTLSGVETSHSTAKTNGTSTSKSETETWNKWMETTVSKTSPSNNLLVQSSSASQSYGGLDSIFEGEAEFDATAQVCGAAALAASGAILGGAAAASGANCNNIKVDFSPEVDFTLFKDLKLNLPDINLPDFNFPNWFNDVDLDVTFPQSMCLFNCSNGSSVNNPTQLANQMASVANTQNKRSAPNQSQYAFYQGAAGNSGNALYQHRYFPASFPLAQPQTTHSTANGSSSGGSRSTTNTTYEEHTITDGEAFLSQESWSKTTAIDSRHAADLWFSYKVRNTGTEFAHEICNLTFNVYLNDELIYTYFVPSDRNGQCFASFDPGEEHIFSARTNTHAIPLTLEQLRAIEVAPDCAQLRDEGKVAPHDQGGRCFGGKLRIAVEDFSYGIDEQFYKEAAGAGIMLMIDDGKEDNDELIDPYLIPTWDPEKVLNVVARYFPHKTDAKGNLIAIWTPEYGYTRSNTPAWCQEAYRPIDYPDQVVWCKHAISTADWWNVYTDGLGDGSEGFQDTQAVPSTVALFRFNKDTDLDGFSDRSETQLGTDPKDATSFPHPEVVAGVYNLRSGNRVTSTLSLLNSGIYDAYGVEAVMVAPDDSVSITNNTVGGSGRVRALKQVIVGSSLKLQTPLPAAWTQANHATLGVGGYYTGPQDRTYTFTVTGCPNGGCTVGSGSWKLDWSDGRGASGQLDFGTNYKSPTFLPVGTLGLTLALYSGNVANGESFTVNARTPRDTFQYTINRQPYTEPLVIVSYNDPQGNHRFVLPSAAMSLTQPTANLQQFAGTMLDDVGVEIVTSRPFTVGVNSATLLVNNPSAKTLQNARLFLEVINISGTVVSEVPTQVNLPPGPTAVPVSFNTGSFNPAYRAADDYIVMAFLTDYQGNILDTAGRPLSSFQVDPLPTLAADDTTLSWNIGTVTQGTLLKHPLALANTGFGRLYTYIPPTSGLALNTLGSRTIGAADQPLYELTLRTADLPVGTYDQTITLATSDPARPTRALRVYGTVTAASGDTSGGVLQRPLDFAVNVPGSHSQGEWVDFTHDLGPNPQNLHPVKVYSQDYSTLYGVGKYATAFGQGTASYDMFGDGRDGVMPSSGNLDYAQGFGVGIINGAAGSTIATVADRHAVGRVNPGDVVLIHQTRGGTTGVWELNKAVSDFTGDGTYIFEKPLQNTYITTGGIERAQILRVPQYANCPITGTVTSLAGWNGDWGGIFAVMCSEVANISGAVSSSNYGFRGFEKWPSPAENGIQGESILGTGTQSTSSNVTGGGGGQGWGDGAAGGGGGSHASVGTSGQPRPNNSSIIGGAGANTILGNATLDTIHFGGSGGMGGSDDSAGTWSPYPCGMGGRGGNGSGIILLSARSVNLSGSFSANGQNGQSGGWLCSGGAGGGAGGAGGAGGSILIRAGTAVFGSNLVTAIGGNGGAGIASSGSGGSGGVGRIRIEYCNTSTGTTNPSASIQKLNCYSTEQVETAPYTNARLNLPETFSNGRTYNVQFGQKFDFSASGEQATALRVPAGLVANSTLDVLVTNAGTGNVTLKLDIGNDGSWDWEATQNVTNAATFASPDLSAAFNQYWTGRGSPTSGNIEIPVKLWLSKAATAFITNLQQLNLTASGSSATLDTKPLDATVIVTGAHTVGEWVQFTHNLGPEPLQNLQPVKVYSQGYSIIYGVGKHATAFDQDTASYDMFGDGRDGVMPVSGNLDYDQGFGVGVVNSGSTGTSSINVSDSHGAWRINPGDAVLIHQTQGNSAGCWEINKSVSDIGRGTDNYQLAKPLRCNYSTSGNNRAQILRVPQYASCDATGTLTPLFPWNGIVGGIFAVMCQNTMTVSGMINASGYGFRGVGHSARWNNRNGVQGEGFIGTGTEQRGQNSSGGGGGQGGQDGGGGGGGGHSSSGEEGGYSSIGNHYGGVGGSPSGNPTLSTIFFGGAGGEGGADEDGGYPGSGGNGGGIVVIFSNQVNITNGIYSTGGAGGHACQTCGGGSGAGMAGGGGGAGGTIFIKGNNITLNTSSTSGGLGGQGSPGRASGGNGGAGRIRVEYCESLIGTTNPPASTQKLNCHIAEQVETAPYNTARLSLPESFTDGRTYKVQFGRKLDFTAAGNQVTTLRVPAGLYNSVQLDALVSGLPANATLALDVGNDGSTEWSSTVANNSTNASADLAAAFTAYWRSQGSATTGTLDVPIKVTTTQPGQVLLTNLQVSATGSRLRYVRIPVATYTSFLLDFTAGSGGTVALDLGDNGTIDWSASLDAPRQLTANLKDALNAYLTGKSGEVAVPVRFYLSPLHPITLNDYQATVASNLDLTASSITVGGGVTAATADSLLIDAGSTARVQATLSNGSSSASGPVTAAFFATATGWGDWYIGSAFVANIPASGNASVSIPWNTTGFSGTVPVKVVINPYRRVAETNYINNSKAITVTVNPPVLLPAAPTGLVATMAATNRINLTWGDASSNESGFKIERSLDGVNGWTPIATVGANVTTYASIGLACGKAYFYRVRSTNSNGDSAFSNVATTLTRLCTPPIQPITAIAATQLTVQWGDNNSNESGFKIERSLTGATPWSQIATVGANVTTYTHSGLQCGTPYYYRVRAYTGSNNSAYSTSVNATTTICPPAAPTLLAATAISATQISLSWQDNSSNESGIKVERSPDGVSGWTLLTTVGANVTGYADNGVACATPYHYRVRATNTGGDSPNSNVANATTPACLPDLIFADGFESGNFSAWSGRPVGTNLRITATAALANSVQGLAAAITTNTGMYLTDQRPVAEPRYRARFYFDPNAILMTNGNAHFLFYGYQGTTSVVLRIEFRRFNDTYQLRAAALNDAPPTSAATWRTTSYVTISDAPHYVEVDWQAATAPCTNNGSLTFWIDGVQRPSLTGLDNDTRRIDIARLGPIGGLDTGTRGSYYFDAFESRRRTYIGPVGGSALAADLTTADETLTTTVGTVLATSALRATEATTLTADMAGLGVEVTFPAISDSEALTAQLRITDTQSLPAGYTLLGDMLTVQTSALVTQPVTITIAYGAAATGTLTTTVSWQQWNASAEQWEALPAQVNQDTQTITAVIKTPATIALWQPETEKLPVESVEENGATEETAAPAQFSIYLPLVQE